MRPIKQSKTNKLYAYFMPFYETIPTISNVITEPYACQVIMRPEFLYIYCKKCPN